MAHPRRRSAFAGNQRYILSLVSILVLGAFGCGAFHNNPEVVAKAYQTAISVFPNVFDKIAFAVYCTPRDQRNYEAFQRILEL